MTPQEMAVHAEAAAKGRQWAQAAFGYEAVREGSIDIDCALTAYEAGYETGRKDALREVAATLRFLPEGGLP